jgi:hypothetical protein
MSAVTDLFSSILKDGIHNTTFFNGRVLTADDLKTEQTANRKRHRRLGQAVGEGVAYGLEINAEGNSTISITPGLALNRMGHTLYLSDTVRIPLVQKPKKEPDKTTDFFSRCVPIPAISSLTGIDIYILVISPAFEERTPEGGVLTRGTITTCNRKYCIEGVQFKLIRIDLDCISGIDNDLRKELKSLMNKSDAASRSKFRNMIAHLFFGTEKIVGFLRHPFERDISNSESPYVTYGILDTLRSLEVSPLTDNDVPLATIHWSEGIKFVDMWSVRRKITDKLPSVMWPLPLSVRRYVENEAVFLQFQEQVEQIFQSNINQSELASIEAKKYFYYLPAAGMIPISESYLEEYMNEEKAVSFTAASRTKGFYPLNFFKNLTKRKPAFIEGAKVEALIRDSLSYPPIDLSSEEMIWLYMVRENGESAITNRIKPPQLYMIFTSGHIPYQGDARFDLARWDYSNFLTVTNSNQT